MQECVILVLECHGLQVRWGGNTGPASRALAGYLGQDCMLAGLVRPGGFVFGAPVSLWFASSLAELERRMGGPVDPRRFRLTVGVDDLTEPVDEETLVGSRLRIGEVDVLVEEWIGRCPVVNLHPEHPGGEADVLAVLADYRTREGKVCWGVKNSFRFWEIKNKTARLGVPFIFEIKV